MLTRKETVCSTANNSVDCCKHPLKMSGLCAEHKPLRFFIADVDSVKSKKQKNLGISGETGMTAKIQPSRLQHVMHPTSAAHWKKRCASFCQTMWERKARLACRLHDQHLEDPVHALNVQSPLLQVACKNALLKHSETNCAHLQNWSICATHC